MKLSVCVLIVTGACAVIATLLAWMWGGKQEDIGSAIGGLCGFSLANGAAFILRGRSPKEMTPEFVPSELGFTYFVFAILYFAFVGWLTGYVHEHGELAGAVCGALGGYILAVSTPAIHHSTFMAKGRKFQLALAAVAFVGLLTVVWVMYEHEFR